MSVCLRLYSQPSARRRTRYLQAAAAAAQTRGCWGLLSWPRGGCRGILPSQPRVDWAGTLSTHTVLYLPLPNLPPTEKCRCSSNPTRLVGLPSSLGMKRCLSTMTAAGGPGSAVSESPRCYMWAIVRPGKKRGVYGRSQSLGCVLGTSPLRNRRKSWKPSRSRPREPGWHFSSKASRYRVSTSKIGVGDLCQPAGVTERSCQVQSRVKVGQALPCQAG